MYLLLKVSVLFFSCYNFLDISYAKESPRIYIREQCNLIRFCDSFVESTYKDPKILIDQDYSRKKGEDNIYLPFLFYVDLNDKYLFLPLYSFENKDIFSESLITRITNFAFRISDLNQDSGDKIKCIFPKNIGKNSFSGKRSYYKPASISGTSTQDFWQIYISATNKTSYFAYFFVNKPELDPVLEIIPVLLIKLHVDGEYQDLFIPWSMLKDFYQTERWVELDTNYFENLKTLRDLGLKNTQPEYFNSYWQNRVAVSNLLELFNYQESGGYLYESQRSVQSFLPKVLPSETKDMTRKN